MSGHQKMETASKIPLFLPRQCHCTGRVGLRQVDKAGKVIMRPRHSRWLLISNRL